MCYFLIHHYQTNENCDKNNKCIEKYKNCSNTSVKEVNKKINIPK